MPDRKTSLIGLVSSTRMLEKQAFLDKLKAKWDTLTPEEKNYLIGGGVGTAVGTGVGALKGGWEGAGVGAIAGLGTGLVGAAGYNEAVERPLAERADIDRDLTETRNKFSDSISDMTDLNVEEGDTVEAYHKRLKGLENRVEAPTEPVFNHTDKIRHDQDMTRYSQAKSRHEKHLARLASEKASAKEKLTALLSDLGGRKDQINRTQTQTGDRALKLKQMLETYNKRPGLKMYDYFRDLFGGK